MFKLVSPLTKNPNQGAATTVYCASHENTESLAGKYFSHCKPVRSTKEANNPETARKLWEVSEEWMKGLQILKTHSAKEDEAECT